MISGRQGKILKDDGCNTNIVSTDIVKCNWRYFKTMDPKLSIKHSNENSSEITNGLVVDATIQIDEH